MLQNKPRIKLKRNALTLEEKMEVLNKINAFGPEFSQRAIARKLGVGKHVVRQLMSREEEIQQQWNSSEYQNCNRRRIRSGKNPAVEEELKNWYLGAVESGTELSGPALMKRAEEIAVELGYMGFKATSGWFTRWKKRTQITTKRKYFSKRTLSNVDTTNTEGVQISAEKCDEEETSMVNDIVNSYKMLNGEESDQRDSYMTDHNYSKLGNDSIISVDHAKQCLDDLRKFFMQEGNETSPMFALDLCTNFVVSKSHSV